MTSLLDPAAPIVVYKASFREHSFSKKYRFFCAYEKESGDSQDAHTIYKEQVQEIYRLILKKAVGKHSTLTLDKILFSFEDLDKIESKLFWKLHFDPYGSSKEVNAVELTEFLRRKVSLEKKVFLTKAEERVREIVDWEMQGVSDLLAVCFSLKTLESCYPEVKWSLFDPYVSYDRLRLSDIRTVFKEALSGKVDLLLHLKYLQQTFTTDYCVLKSLELFNDSESMISDNNEEKTTCLSILQTSTLKVDLSKTVDEESDLDTSLRI